MGLKAGDGVLLCALVLLQLVCACQCLNGASWRTGMHHGDRKQELPKRALLDTDTDVLRSSLVRRDSRSNATAIEKFLAAVKRSQARVTQLEENLQRRVEAQADTTLQSPVSPGGGEYVMQFAVGTPPQQFSAIVDTGSDLCWVQCSPCTRCFQQPDALFDPTASSTYKQIACSDDLCQDLGTGGFSCSRRNTCSYLYSYGDQSSTQGDLAFETVTLAPSSVPKIAIGCGRKNQGTFTDADGLVGLGQGPLSFPSQISPSVANIFSYCLVEQTSNPGTSPITFGSSAANANVKYTPVVSNPTNPTFWYVQVTGITIGGRAVTIPSSAFRISSSGAGGVIFDSGTTITQWVTAAYNPILAAFQRQISYPKVSGSQFGLNLCYDVSGVDSVTLPDMVVGLSNNVQFEIPAENLWIAVDNSGTTICLALGESQGLTIIGNIQQQNVLIVYDGVNQQLGFETTQCSTL